MSLSIRRIECSAVVQSSVSQSQAVGFYLKTDRLLQVMPGYIWRYMNIVRSEQVAAAAANRPNL